MSDLFQEGALRRSQRVAYDRSNFFFIVMHFFKTSQYFLSIRDRWKVFNAEIIQVATPTITTQVLKSLTWVFHFTFPPFRHNEVERIQVNVKRDIHEVGLPFDKNLFIFSLPQGTASFVAFVEIFCIPHVDLLHEKRNASVYQL